MHRIFGIALFLYGMIIYLNSKKLYLSAHGQKIIKIVGHILVLQFVLGVSTLVLKVPLVLASLHQLFACVLFLVTIKALFCFYPSRNV